MEAEIATINNENIRYALFNNNNLKKGKKHGRNEKMRRNVQNIL